MAVRSGEAANSCLGYGGLQSTVALVHHHFQLVVRLVQLLLDWGDGRRSITVRQHSSKPKTTHALHFLRGELQTPFLYAERVPIVSRVRHLASLDYRFFQQSLEELPQRKQKMRPSSELASFSRTC